MKTCDKHHGQIQYDGVIYLECPLCRVADYDEVVEEIDCVEARNDNLKL